MILTRAGRIADKLFCCINFQRTKEGGARGANLRSQLRYVRFPSQVLPYQVIPNNRDISHFPKFSDVFLVIQPERCMW